MDVITSYSIHYTKLYDSIAKGIEDGRQIVGNLIRQLEGIDGRQLQVLGKRAGSVDPHALGMKTQVRPAGAAIATVSTGDA